MASKNDKKSGKKADSKNSSKDATKKAKATAARDKELARAAAKQKKKLDKKKLDKKKLDKKKSPRPSKAPAPTSSTTPTLVPNESWTVTALRARARALAIPGYSRMTKAELLDKLIAT